MQALSIYKHVMPQSELNDKKEMDNQFQQAVPVSIDSTDDAYEYFSDEEEAKQHRKNKKKPKAL